jgi:hypothetical protein
MINEPTALTEKESSVPAINTDEEIQEAMEVTGQKRAYMPFIDTLRVNNKEEKKEIDGRKVKVQPKRGFIKTIKNEAKEYVKELIDAPVSGVILKYRQKIQSGYKQEPAFLSDEFDDYKGIIQLHNAKNWKEIISKGNYHELCKEYATGEKNTFGHDKKSFNLLTIFYVCDLEGNLFKVEAKTKKNVIDYRNSFGDNDPHLGVVTIFDLEWVELEGASDHWNLTLKRGDQVRLSEYLPKAKDLIKGLQIIENSTEKTKVAGEVVSDTEVQETKEFFQPDNQANENINVENIPF